MSARHVQQTAQDSLQTQPVGAAFVKFCVPQFLYGHNTSAAVLCPCVMHMDGWMCYAL